MLIFSHPACLLHNPGAAHPEQPQRLVAVIESLRGEFQQQLQWQDAPLATDETLLLAHDASLISQLRLTEPSSGVSRLDADTVMSPGSLEASLRSTGAVCAAIDAVMQGSSSRAFCAVRPPGHHSTNSSAMGFCLFNQVAVGARYAQHAYRLDRVAIVDFDVHHCNGTQAIFEQDDSVLVVSSHQSPLYPGTGSTNERGAGNIVNGELAPGAGSQAFRELWKLRLLPAIDLFAPQLILISAGFDAHHLDPLADLNLGASDYRWITLQLMGLAEKHANGRIVSSLEGGYSLTALRKSSIAHVGALIDHRVDDLDGAITHLSANMP